MQFDNLLASETLAEHFDTEVDDWNVLWLRPKADTLVRHTIQVTHDFLLGWSANVVGNDGEVRSVDQLSTNDLYDLLHTIIEEAPCTQE